MSSSGAAAVRERLISSSFHIVFQLSAKFAGLGGRTDDVGHWLCEISHDKAAISAPIPLSQKVYTFFVYPLTIATPNLQPRILHDPDPIGIVLGYRLTGGGARFFPTLWQGTVVALITRLPTYCRFHGLAVAKFVRRHHPPCDSVGSLRRSCRNNSQSIIFPHSSSHDVPFPLSKVIDSVGLALAVTMVFLTSTIWRYPANTAFNCESPTVHPLCHLSAGCSIIGV